MCVFYVSTGGCVGVDVCCYEWDCVCLLVWGCVVWGCVWSVCCEYWVLVWVCVGLYEYVLCVLNM